MLGIGLCVVGGGLCVGGVWVYGFIPPPPEII